MASMKDYFPTRQRLVKITRLDMQSFHTYCSHLNSLFNLTHYLPSMWIRRLCWTHLIAIYLRESASMQGFCAEEVFQNTDKACTTVIWHSSRQLLLLEIGHSVSSQMEPCVACQLFRWMWCSHFSFEIWGSAKTADDFEGSVQIIYALWH